jgi:hypothetical protein
MQEVVINEPLYCDRSRPHLKKAQSVNKWATWRKSPRKRGFVIRFPETNIKRERPRTVNDRLAIEYPAPSTFALGYHLDVSLFWEFTSDKVDPWATGTIGCWGIYGR